jgi:hypothetical protein
MKIERVPKWSSFVLLIWLVTEFLEPLEDEWVETQPRENDKPSMDFAVNSNNGNDEDE